MDPDHIYGPSGFLLYEDLGRPTFIDSCHLGLVDIKFYKRTYPARSDGKAMILILNYDGEKYIIKDQYIGD